MLSDETRFKDGFDFWIDKIGSGLGQLMHDLVTMRKRDRNDLVIMGKILIWRYNKWPNAVKIHYCAKCE